MLQTIGVGEGDIVRAQERLELFDPGFEIKDIAGAWVSAGLLALYLAPGSGATDLRGISFFVMGS